MGTHHSRAKLSERASPAVSVTTAFYVQRIPRITVQQFRNVQSSIAVAGNEIEVFSRQLLKLNLILN